jgi:hypothetical protein
MICKKSVTVRAVLAWTVCYILHIKVILTTSKGRSGISVPRFFYYKIILGGTEKENQWLRPTQIKGNKNEKNYIAFHSMHYGFDDGMFPKQHYHLFR